MAQASKRLKRYRRIKRENTLLYRGVVRLQKERDFYAKGLEELITQLKEREKAATKPKGGVIIEKVSDETEVTSAEANNNHDAGL